MQFSYACLNFKVSSECLLQGISCIRLAIGLQYELPTCILNTALPTLQQFRDGVMLRMCCGLTLATLFVRFFDRYYVATIPKSRFEFQILF